MNVVCDINEDLSNLLKKFVKFGDFKLREKKSNYYIDIKTATTKPKILKLISQQIIKKMITNNIEADYIACLELGSIPIGTIVSVEANLPLIIIRKTEKDYGIDGRIIGDLKEQKMAILLEDVVTTGGNAVDAINVLRSKKLIVQDVIAVVDRKEGGRDNLLKENINLISLVNVEDLLGEIQIEK